MTINSLTPYTGTVPNKATQTDIEFSDAVYSTHQFYDKTFVSEMNTVIDRLNNNTTELNNQMMYSQYVGDWDIATEYTTGQSVSYHGLVYYAKSINIGFEPDVYNNKWQEAVILVDKSASNVSYNNTVSGLTSITVQSAIDEIAETRELAEITKTFSAGESYNIPLARPVSVTLVAVEKETVDGELTDNTWDIATNGYDYDVTDYTKNATIKPSATSGYITLTLNGASWVTADVGRTVSFNGGTAVIIDINGKAYVKTAFSNTSEISAGDWTLKDATFDENGITISNLNLKYELSLMGKLENSVYNIQESLHDETAHNLGNASSDGTRCYVTVPAHGKVYQYELSNPFVASSASYSSKYLDISAYPTAKYFKRVGTQSAYMTTTDGKARGFYLSVDGQDISTAESTSLTNIGSLIGESTAFSFDFSSDGLHLLVCMMNTAKCYSFSCSTPFLMSSASYDSVYSNVLTATQTECSSIQYSQDGLSLFADDTNGVLRKYKLETAFDISTVSYDSQASGISSASFSMSNDGQNVIFFGIFNQVIKSYKMGIQSSKLMEYIVATTNVSGQVLTSNWTSSNLYTGYETINGNGGTVSYAISNDGNTTFYVQKESNAVRAIARLNTGVWEYNSNVMFTGVTWMAASVNSKSDCLKQAMEVAVNRMSKQQMFDAITLIQPNDYLDLAIMLYAPSIDAIHYCDGVVIDYSANSNFKGAINGIDYEYTHPAQNRVVVKALIANNYKVRIL